MAARQRRRPSPQAVRLALILALNATLLVVLWRLLASDATQAAPPDGAAREQAEGRELPDERLPELSPSGGLDAQSIERLQRAIDAAVVSALDAAQRETRGRASDAQVSVHVREVGTSNVEGWGIEADRALRPASSLKLVTTAAALILLGDSWCFQTRFEVQGTLSEGVLDGNLVVRAGADPLFDRNAKGEVDHLLAPALEALVAAGLRHVRGRLVLDEGAYPEPAPGPAWPSAGQHWSEYCALFGGFSANRGCLTVSVSPTRPGEPAEVAILPRPHGLDEQVSLITHGAGRLDVHLGAQADRVRVSGKIPARAEPWSESCAHPDPVQLFGAVLRGSLERRGVQIDGATVRERGAAAGTTLATLSTPLTRYLASINTDSNNALADHVFFALGHAVTGKATRSDGARATAEALRRLGVPSEGLVQVDGSGLSRDDRVSARQMTALLCAVLGRSPRLAQSFLESLAVAGESGTLEDRFQHSPARGRVRAKTGFIAGTSALCGAADTLSGRRLVFAILVNYPNEDGLNTRVWKPMQDRIGELLVGVDS